MFTKIFTAVVKLNICTLINKTIPTGYVIESAGQSDSLLVNNELPKQ